MLSLNILAQAGQGGPSSLVHGTFFMPVLLGPDVAHRRLCFLSTQDLAQFSAASASSFRLAGCFALLHQVANDACTEQTALHSLELKYFEADKTHRQPSELKEGCLPAAEPPVQATPDRS